MALDLDITPIPEKRPARGLRAVFDVSALLSVAGLLVGGGMAWQKFMDHGQRLDQHEQEIAQLTQIAQTTAQNLAVLNQKVDDVQTTLKNGN